MKTIYQVIIGCVTGTALVYLCYWLYVRYASPSDSAAVQQQVAKATAQVKKATGHVANVVVVKPANAVAPVLKRGAQRVRSFFGNLKARLFKKPAATTATPAAAATHAGTTTVVVPAAGTTTVVAHPGFKQDVQRVRNFFGGLKDRIFHKKDAAQ